MFDDFLHEVLGYIDYRVLAAGIVAYLRAREGTLVSYPHVSLALLRLFRMHLKLAVVSDAPRMQVWMRLVQLGVDMFFDSVVTFDDTGQIDKRSNPALSHVSDALSYFVERRWRRADQVAFGSAHIEDL